MNLQELIAEARSWERTALMPDLRDLFKLIADTLAAADTELGALREKVARVQSLYEEAEGRESFKFLAIELSAALKDVPPSAIGVELPRQEGGTQVVAVVLGATGASPAQGLTHRSPAGDGDKPGFALDGGSP